jgi:hypothetical protein
MFTPKTGDSPELGRKQVINGPILVVRTDL